MPPDRERDLERELRELGPQLDYPPTPDLASTIRQRLEENGAEQTARRGWPTILSSRWAAAAAVLVLFIAIPILSPAARDTLSGLFVAGQGAGDAAQSGAEGGGGGGEAGGGAGGGAGGDAAGRGYAEAPMMQEDAGGDLPASSGSASSGGSEDPADSQASTEDAGGDMPTSGGSADSGGDLPTSGGPPQAQGAPGQSLGLGERISLQEARARVDKVFVPAEIGEPDAVYAAGPEGVVLVYRARPDLPPLGNTGVGLILTELPGDTRSAYFPESPRPYSGTEAVSVDGVRGYWSSAGGSANPNRSASFHANVLLWEREGRALRIESGLPRGEAIRIAESAR